jgi:hypothetical protein
LTPKQQVKKPSVFTAKKINNPVAPAKPAKSAQSVATKAHVEKPTKAKL